MSAAMDRRFIRHYVIIGLLLAAAVATIARYGSLALSGRGGKGSPDSPAVLVRGPIYDREGRLLAVDTDLYDVSGWKPSLDARRLEEYALRLADALGTEYGPTLERLGGDGPDFMYLARRVSGESARTLRASLAQAGLPGLRFDRVAGRVYPERDLAAHLVGFVGTENTGLAGAEVAFQRDLAADPAKAEGGYAYGNAVYLTIDADLQYRLELLCADALEVHKAEAVMMVAMEARTGLITAYVSLPDFDPNDFLAAERDAWQDRVAIFAYEPGSVFKVYSMASVMSLGGIDEHSGFECDGAYERVMPSGETVTIKCLGTHGMVDFEGILEFSCNAGAAYASDTVGTVDFYGRIRDFGFGERVGADLAGESPGMLARPQDWSGRSKPTIAIGQETLVTALQMASAATALANGGVLLRPRTLARVADPAGMTLAETRVTPVRRVLDERTALATLAAMEAVVLESGTGKRARIEDLRMSVKTGTAQMIDRATRRYSSTDFIASTIALFPSEAPEYIVYAAIVKPRGESIYGGRIVAPLVKDAANAIADLYGLARSDTAEVEHGGAIVVPPGMPAVIGDVMPDLRGTAKRFLTPLLERTDITVEIEGDGWVVSQEPEPGQPVPPGSVVRLRLE